MMMGGIWKTRMHRYAMIAEFGTIRWVISSRPPLLELTQGTVHIYRYVL